MEKKICSKCKNECFAVSITNSLIGVSNCCNAEIINFKVGREENKIEFESEEDAYNFLEEFGFFDNEALLKKSIKDLHDQGYIKKSELEKAQEAYYKYKEYDTSNKRDYIQSEIITYVNALEKETKKLNQRIVELLL